MYVFGPVPIMQAILGSIFGMEDTTFIGMYTPSTTCASRGSVKSRAWLQSWGACPAHGMLVCVHSLSPWIVKPHQVSSNGLRDEAKSNLHKVLTSFGPGIRRTATTRQGSQRAATTSRQGSQRRSAPGRRQTTAA